MYQYYPVRAGELRDELPGETQRPAVPVDGGRVNREAGLVLGRSAGRARAAVAAAHPGPLLFVVSQFILAGMLRAPTTTPRTCATSTSSPGEMDLANVVRAIGAALLALPL